MTLISIASLGGVSICTYSLAAQTNMTRQITSGMTVQVISSWRAGCNGLRLDSGSAAIFQGQVEDQHENHDGEECGHRVSEIEQRIHLRGDRRGLSGMN